MRRDIANEVVVAIVAVAVIAFALSFGILLTLSSNTDSTRGERVTQTVTEAAVSVGRTLTIVRIDSPVFVSATPNTSETDAPTEALTIFTLLAPTQTSTRPSVPTSAITSASATAVTAVPTTVEAATTVDSTTTVEVTANATEADTVDSTNSIILSPSVAPSFTPTATSTRAARSTVEPTATFTSTLKPTFTLTATPTATLTFAPTATKPTVTPTSTHTITATHTATAKATEVPTVTQSPNSKPPTLVPTVAPSAVTQMNPVTQVGGGCQPRTDWPRYLMATGDTLASIAQNIQVTESELSAANCLDDNRVLIVGDVLFVPKLPILPTPANGFPLPALRKLGCVDENYADISNLYPSQRLSGSFVILGTALLDTQFTQYILEIRPHAELTYTVFAQGNKTVSNGELARHDTSQYDDGIYWLRLIIRDASGVVAPNGVCVVPVAFD